MTSKHQAPDGGLCYSIKGDRHAQVRTFGAGPAVTAWEGISDTACPTSRTAGTITCINCDSGRSGTVSDARQHAGRCEGCS